MRVARLVSAGMLTLLCVGIGRESTILGAQALASQDIVHEVQRGDNLRLIAGYYYGDTRHWEQIWRTNRAEVRNPNRIAPGTFLRIPDATTPAESYADFLARVRRPSAASETEGKAATAPGGPPPAAGPASGQPPGAGMPGASSPPTPRP